MTAQAPAGGPAPFLDSLAAATPEQVAAIRESNFARTMDLVFAHHPHYRRVFAERGIARRDIASLADLARVPVTTKGEYAADPESFRLRLPDGPAEERVLWDVMYTTGSSGNPAAFYTTPSDYYTILFAGRRMLELRGVRENDSIANLFPMTVYPNGAYNRTLQLGATMGIPVVAPLPGNPSPYFRLGRRLDEVVAIVARSRSTILWGVSSYVRRVVDRARALGADFSAVRHVFVSGEATSEELRAAVLDGLRAMGARDPRVSVSYGITEIQGGLVECRAGSGYHNVLPESYLWEVVDPATHAPVPHGQPGLVLLTHLDRRGTVMLRYAIGDISAMTEERCPHCGRLGERFIQVPRRADSRVKVKGMLIDTEQLSALLDAMPGLADYVVVLDRENPGDPASGDVLTVLAVAAQSGAGGLPGRIAGEVKRVCGVTPRVQLVAPSSVRDVDLANKARRFVNRRDAGGR